jgi:DNA-binding SARP family transcriptional activator/TolB-like protein
MSANFGLTLGAPAHAAQAAPTSAVALRLRLIGHMEAATANGENVLPAGRKTRALLAVIALSAPRPALRSRLAEMLWSRRPEEQARASLRQEIHRLHEALSPTVVDVMLINRDHLTLRTNLVWVDVNDVMRATTSQPAPLSLLEGDLLEDLDGVDPAFDSWLAAERERLRDRARKLAEDLLGEQTDPETTIPAAQRLLAIDRAHEGAWRAMMRAYAARGERGMAIQAYERCRAVLADLLDAAPSSETQRLLTEIRGPGSRILPRRPASPEPSSPSSAEPGPAGGSVVAALAASPPAAAQGPAPAASPADVLADPVAPDKPATERPEPTPAGSFARAGSRIGVLPLQLMGATEDESQLSIGLADEITTALARFRSLFVVSSTSIARFAEASRDESAIQRMFGLDFLLDGTGQRVRNRLRITLRLLDLRAGNQVVWTGRFDRQTHDLLNLQDEVAAETVAQIDAEILQIEAARAAARPLTPETNAYDLTLRALPLASRMDRGGFLQAGELLGRAVAQSPDYAGAHAAYALWQLVLVGQDWAINPRDHAERASELAERAIMLDPQDARALTIAGHVRTELNHRLREGAALHERALSINPNQAMAWGLSGITHAYLGEIEEAERRLNRYKRLLPLSRHAFMYDTCFVMVALMKRDYETAVTVGREVTEMNPLHSAGMKPYLAALGHLGRCSEAAVVLRKLAAIEPDFSVQRFLARAPFARLQDRDHYANGLRLAGVPALDAQLAGY